MKATDLAILVLLAWTYHKLTRPAPQPQNIAAPPPPAPPVVSPAPPMVIQVVPKHPCPMPGCGGAMKMREEDGAKWCNECEEVFYSTPEANGELGPGGEWMPSV